MDLLEEQPVVLLPPPKPVNTQLYANSVLAGSEVEKQAVGEGFFNAKLPNLAICHEKPEHRAIMLLKAQGMTNTEIAQKTGYSIPWISQIIRQPWFQIGLVQLLKTLGENPVKEFLNAQMDVTLVRLAQLRDQNGSLPVAMAATKEWLDRFLGKPVQISQQLGSNVKSSEDKFDNIDEELKRLEDEERALIAKQLSPAAAESLGGSTSGVTPPPAIASTPVPLVNN